MPPVGFEPVIPASERAQNHHLDHVTTGTGWMYLAKEILVSELENEIMSLSQWPGTLLN